ncbi:hypothetical protein [Tetragenococcus koreensis]|uniref:hypothetical protein n=1 Tax=Tetragenococcus koreensis TaxID=290335 RepID=UPI001F1798E6|nr:hypothetical protein [Tetragenococcus koreensis]MCF1632929.1 hypothetical protein [Tetragenococcus koreensis]
MNNDDNQFFDFLNQYMNDGNSKEENELMRATSLLSKASHIFINNGFDKDQAMELTLEYVSSALTNGGN